MFSPRQDSGGLIAPPDNPVPADGSVAQALFLEARRRRRHRWLAGGAAVAVTAAVAISAVTWIPGLSGRGTGHAGGPGTALPARSPALTGQAVFTWRATLDGRTQGYGAQHVTFARKDKIVTYSATDLARTVAFGQTRTGVDRIVGGQIYDRIPAPRRLRWVRERYMSVPDVAITDPRILLRMMARHTPFQAAGYQVIGGARLKVLRATDPGRLAHLGLLPVLWTTAPLAQVQVGSVEIWVDGRGVAHRMVYAVRYPARGSEIRPSSQAALLTYYQDERAQLRLARSPVPPGRAARAHWRQLLRLGMRREMQAASRAFPPHGRMEVTTATVTFSAVGQPQHITMPPGSISLRQASALNRPR